MKNFRFCWVFTALMVCLSPKDAKSQSAWWVDFERPPAETELFGGPVSDLDPDFVKASLLTDEDMPSDAWTNPDFSFRYKADIDSDGQEEIAEVGTYETKDGALGRWVVIRDVATGKIEFLEKFPGEAGFSALGNPQGKLMVAFCLYCGNLVFVEPTEKDRYKIVEPDYSE